MLADEWLTAGGVYLIKKTHVLFNVILVVSHLIADCELEKKNSYW